MPSFRTRLAAAVLGAGIVVATPAARTGRPRPGPSSAVGTERTPRLDIESSGPAAWRPSGIASPPSTPRLPGPAASEVVTNKHETALGGTSRPPATASPPWPARSRPTPMSRSRSGHCREIFSTITGSSPWSCPDPAGGRL